jgi:Cu+-exporting ATPase
MCAEVESDAPGECPKCGMALERNPAWVPVMESYFTCPMHPEVRQAGPGDCPECWMALELGTTTAREPEGSDELRYMTGRLWICGVLALPVFIAAMAHLVPALARQL